MKTIIAGSREITSYPLLLAAIKSCPFSITSVISGGARGVDLLGIQFAKENHLPLTIIYPEWNTFGKSAGYRRNEVMAQQAEAVLALWDGHSKGTKHMIDIANKYHLHIHTVKIGE